MWRDKAATGDHQVVGDGMVWTGKCVKQGDLCAREKRTGVRASIVALKRRNGRGAKGGRKVGALRSGTRNIPRYRVAVWSRPPETSAAISRTNRVLRCIRTLTTSVMAENDSSPSPYRGCSLTYILHMVSQSPCGVNHQLESRMRETRTYGSEGGAPGNRSFLPLSIVIKAKSGFSQVFQDVKDVQHEKGCGEICVYQRPERTLSVQDTDQLVTFRQSLIDSLLQAGHRLFRTVGEAAPCKLVLGFGPGIGTPLVRYLLEDVVLQCGRNVE